MEFLLRDKIFKKDHLPTFCSVDAGGESLARNYAKSFSGELIIAHKQRSYEKNNHVEQIRILSDSPLQNKVVWVVDDMIDTGSSVVTLCEELKKRGVKAVHVAIVHSVFSPPALERLATLYDQGLLHRLITTDTLEPTKEVIEKLPFIEVVRTTRRTAEIILRLYDEESLSPFF